VLRGRSKLFWVVVALVIAAVIFYLPSLVAYRYTADAQRTSYLTHPWRSWRFVVAALTVPGDSQLKTSGAAFRRADETYHGTRVDVVEAQLLYLPVGKPYTFVPLIGDGSGGDGTPVAQSDAALVAALRQPATIAPTFRFVWQIEGFYGRGPSAPETIVAMLDYRNGHLLWDIRDVAGGVR
jgi:hypothetical protein